MLAKYEIQNPQKDEEIDSLESPEMDKEEHEKVKEVTHDEGQGTKITVVNQKSLAKNKVAPEYSLTPSTARIATPLSIRKK